MSFNLIKFIRYGIVSIFLMLFFALKARAEFIVEVKSAKPEVFQSLADQITKDLPLLIKNELNDKVEIVSKHLNENKPERLNDKCNERLVLARVNKLNSVLKVEIDPVLLKEWLYPERKIQCPHKTNHQYVKATIVHEIFHLYDFKTGFSKDNEFLNLAGFIKKGLIIKKRTNLNQNATRTPDRYEFKNSLENAAVNFEHFLYDPNYRCHRPVHFNYYENKLDHEVIGSKDCEINDKIVISSQTQGSSPVQEKRLDPKRLYEIHYLFAGKGDAVMSRFGHSMYRLVMCAPGKEVGPSCLNDYAYHIIVSFRANITDTTMSYTKGISGEYPSQLFFLTLTDVINEYTKGEFREIRSLPLKLSDKQKETFLRRSSELFWSYRGKYFFFTNNCATEAMNLLKVSMSDNPKVLKKEIVTPVGLYDFLIKTKIGNEEIFNDLKLAERKGYYFPSASVKAQKSLAVLGLEKTDFNSFFNTHNSLLRRDVYFAAIEKADDKTLVAANALRVEELIIKANEMKFTKEMGAKLFGQDQDQRILESKLGDKVKEVQSLYQELSVDNYVQEGYGIPLVNEFISIPSEKISEVMNKLKSYSLELQEITSHFFKEDVEEMKNMYENKIELLKVIAQE